MLGFAFKASGQVPKQTVRLTAAVPRRYSLKSSSAQEIDRTFLP